MKIDHGDYTSEYFKPDDNSVDPFALNGGRPPAGESPPEIVILSKLDFTQDFVPPDYLIDGMLQRRFIYSLTGQTGHAKTAVALLIAQLVGSTAPNALLANHSVEHGRVAYFVGENPDDVRMRIIGADSRRSDDPTADRILGIRRPREAHKHSARGWGCWARSGPVRGRGRRSHGMASPLTGDQRHARRTCSPPN